MHSINQALFFAKVRKAKNCWLWAGRKDKWGYGRFSVEGENRLAHRVSWLIHNGPIPKGSGSHGTCVCHHCDNPSCVNPAHLFLGSNADNMRDMKEKGRVARGEGHYASKLTAEDVAAIREDQRTQWKIANGYGVDRSLVGQIKRRQIWRHVK